MLDLLRGTCTMKIKTLHLPQLFCQGWSTCNIISKEGSAQDMNLHIDVEHALLSAFAAPKTLKLPVFPTLYGADLIVKYVKGESFQKPLRRHLPRKCPQRYPASETFFENIFLPIQGLGSFRTVRAQMTNCILTCLFSHAPFGFSNVVGFYSNWRTNKTATRMYK